MATHRSTSLWLLSTGSAAEQVELGVQSLQRLLALPGDLLLDVRDD